jgi:hypothetical protein
MLGRAKLARVVDQNLWIGIRLWDRKPLFLEQRYVLFHSPPGFVEAIFDGTSDSREPFKFGGVKAEECRIFGGLDCQ